jgi:hypothetical protein
MKPLLVKLGVLSIGLSIIGNAEVWGSDWRLVHKGRTGDTFWDVESISYLEGGIVRLWEKEVLNEKGIDTYIQRYGVTFRNVAEHNSLIEIDCLNKKYRYLSVNWYSKDNDLISDVKKPADWMYITPDSWGDSASKTLCK